MKNAGNLPAFFYFGNCGIQDFFKDYKPFLLITYTLMWVIFSVLSSAFSYICSLDEKLHFLENKL
ncbi:MAG: hypothetical protein BGO42_16875 [Flavobacterium sp. 40-81]|nr:MAG: hypothetical protein BGO42_16875 [Flavobacterium sp. 40-81]